MLRNVEADTFFGFVPIPGLVLLALALAWLVLRRTDTGLALYTVGTDETSAGLSGISVVRTRFVAFVGAGLVYGLAGFMLSAQTATGDPNGGRPFLMLTFAAVALGGTSLSGGGTNSARSGLQPGPPTQFCSSRNPGVSDGSMTCCNSTMSATVIVR